MRKANYDGACKNWMLFHLRETLAFFQPELEQAIDWDTRPVFLDKSFQNAFLGIPTPRKEVDMLIQIALRSGHQRLLLLHIEFQHSREKAFGKRMYVYHCRIFGQFQQEVLSLGILGDASPDWRPTGYGYECFGSKTDFEFPCVKILDYQGREAELEASDSTIAIIILAHLAAIKGRKDPTYRFQAKYRLMRMLIDKRRDRLQIRHLMGFLEQILVLEDEMEVKLYQQLNEEDVVDAVLEKSYIWQKLKEAAIQRLIAKEKAASSKEGREEGLEVGREEGLSEALADILQSRFGLIPKDFHERVKNCDLPQLKKWIVSASTSNQIQDVFA